MPIPQADLTDADEIPTKDMIHFESEDDAHPRSDDTFIPTNNPSLWGPI
jgi:hypothetical protein